MATFRHPETGVILNELGVFRPRNLSEAEAETARILRRAGHKVQDITSMLGTNPGRVARALGEEGRGRKRRR